MSKSKLVPSKSLVTSGAVATLAGVGRITATAAVAGAVTMVVAAPVAKYVESRLQRSTATEYLSATRGKSRLT